MANNNDNLIVSYVEAMLTTVDNPYDYFTQFDEWLMFDKRFDYNCCEYLDRIIEQNGGISDDLTEKEENELITKAIDEIVSTNPTGIFKKVTRNVMTVPDDALDE